jgi:serine-type D-Ala-D-Ala carboxypeptidase (penicillin-binding protein 5/6)
MMLNHFHFKPTWTLRQVRLSPLLFVAGILFILACAGFGPPVITDGQYPPIRLEPNQIAALVSAKQPPQVTASAALLLDLDTGQVLYARHEADPLPPASTAKIMTALVVLQNANGDDMVRVSATAAAQGGSRMGLAAGETLSVRELLYGLLMPSGNDAAVALAEHVAGTEADFVDMMNRTAEKMGLAATHFANSHGLDADGQTTSSQDLAALAKAALQYPLFEEIVRTQTAQIAGHDLVNTNELLGAYPGTDGVKTGTTDEAGECLVASVNQDGHRVIAVILGSRDRYADARTLLDYAGANWRWGPTGLPADALAWETGSDGRLYRLRSAGSSDIFLPAWQWPLVQPVRRIDASAAFTSTLPVGTLDWTLGRQVVASTPLTVQQAP